MRLTRRTLGLTVLAAPALAQTLAGPQAGPIRFVVPFGPGDAPVALLFSD